MEISNWRKALGYTQADMAKIFDVTVYTYFRKEKGYSPFTDEEKIVFRNLVNNVFPDITVGELFFDGFAKKMKENEV